MEISGRSAMGIVLDLDAITVFPREVTPGLAADRAVSEDYEV